LEANELTTLRVRDVLANSDYPNLNLLASTMSDDFVQDSPYGALNTSPQNIILTFNNLIKNTNLVKLLDAILTLLENTWKQPVDIEFTAMIEKNRTVRINLLQCRPLRLPRAPDSMPAAPKNIDSQHILFKSTRLLSGGIVDNIKYIIYIDPEKYSAMASVSMKRSLGRVIGKLNEHLRSSEGKVMAIGPGRWGSTNVDLGVNVSYADLDNVSVLVEVGLTKSGSEPELSYGTHFFQDLVEAEIIYMPVFPDKRTAGFNKRFFTKSPNVLSELLPEYSDFEDVVYVIDVPAASNGAFAHVAADILTRQAVCYLK
jgi:pyruvate, water dikinase